MSVCPKKVAFNNLCSREGNPNSTNLGEDVSLMILDNHKFRPLTSEGIGSLLKTLYPKPASDFSPGRILTFDLNLNKLAKEPIKNI